MIYSSSKQFIFVRNWKTAGSSIRFLLKNYQPFYRQNKYIEYVLRKIERSLPANLKLVPIHADAQTIRQRVGYKTFDQFFTFGFVRNPWDWQVSLYFFILKRRKHPLHKFVSKLSSFDEYIRWHVIKDIRLQKEFFSDSNGKIIVDFIGKFENLNEDFDYIQDCIGIKKVKIPHINKTKHKDFRTYYNDKTAQLIDSHYKKDIEFFNYKFS